MGKSISYLTNTLTKLETGSKLEPDKELGIKGFYVSGILIKSRNSEAGITFKMVFEQKIGINNLLTNFVNLKDMGRITGAGRSFKLDTCPDVKFSIKEFSEKYNSNSELRKAFDKAVKEEYMKFIPDEFNFNKKEEIKDNNEDENKKEKTSKKSKYVLISEGDGTDDNPDIYKDKKGRYYIIEDGEYIEVDYDEEDE